MRLTNLHQLPDSIVRAITQTGYDGRTNDLYNISASDLISPLRKSLLEFRHDNEIIEDVSDNIWILFGNCIHYILGKQDEESIIERRFEAFINDFTVTGKPDNYSPKTKTLIDYKVTSTYTLIYSPNGKQDWVEQMNVYVWLLRKNGYEVDECKIVAILRDWQERESELKLDYPKVAIQQIHIPIWTKEKQEKFIWDKLDQRKIHMSLPDDKLPVCTPEERWATPTTWAFLKTVDSAKATRVLKTEEEANVFAKANPELMMVVRPGEDRRCQKYCSVNQFCYYWKGKYG